MPIAFNPRSKISGVCLTCGAPEGELHRDGCAYGFQYGEEELPPTPITNNVETSIPPEVMQYAPEIRRFVDAMVYKLGVKAHKGKWENMTIGRAMELLRGEERELTEAIERGNMVEIMLEAADVANFALIISAIAMEKK
jgi:hypothetical protein